MDRLISDRLESIHQTLLAAYKASNELKGQTSVKGNEREIFVAAFLREMFPPHFRFSSGVIIDERGRRTGQLDVVIELPFAPSFSLGHGAPRVYFADTVGAVIEVKSNLESKERKRIEQQLKQRMNGSDLCALKDTHRSVYVRRKEGKNDTPSKTIPAYVVGYTGPGRQTLEDYVEEQRKQWNDDPHFDSWFRGILQIDGSFFFGSDGCFYEGPQAIGAFINSLYFELNRAVWGHAQLGRYFDLTSVTEE